MSNAQSRCVVDGGCQDDRAGALYLLAAIQGVRRRSTVHGLLPYSRVASCSRARSAHGRVPRDLEQNYGRLVFLRPRGRILALTPFLRTI